MGMIKSDTESLLSLKNAINTLQKEFNERIERFKSLQSTISSNWNDEQCGSFIDALQRIYQCREDVDSGCREVNHIIDELIDITNRYSKIKFN